MDMWVSGCVGVWKCGVCDCELSCVALGGIHIGLGRGFGEGANLQHMKLFLGINRCCSMDSMI